MKTHETTPKPPTINHNTNKGLYMTQNTKYVLSLLALLFIVTAGYAGYIIYNNNHGGSSNNIFANLLGKNKPKVTNNTPLAKQIQKQNQQYNTKTPTIKSDSIASSAQKQIITDFFNEYFTNKKAHTSQDAALSKYGTNNLRTEYNSTRADFDPLTCTSSIVESLAVTDGSLFEGFTKFSLEFGDSSGLVSSAQVLLSGQGASSKIDSVGCKGPI